MDKLTLIVERIGKALDYAAGFCLAATMVVVVINVLLRVILRNPLLGTMEYVNILTALTISLALAYCAFRGGHIAVDLVVDKMPEKSKAVIDAITGLAALVFWAVAAYYMVEYGATMLKTGLVTATTGIPIYPVAYLIALSLVVLGMVLVQRILASVRKVLS